MKYAVMANLSFETPAKRDQMSQIIKDKIAGKLLWGIAHISEGIDVDKKPFAGIELRFENKTDMEGLFALIKDKIALIPVLKGWISKHDCTHDESSPKPCIIGELYQKD